MKKMLLKLVLLTVGFWIFSNSFADNNPYLVTKNFEVSYWEKFEKIRFDLCNDWNQDYTIWDKSGDILFYIEFENILPWNTSNIYDFNYNLKETQIKYGECKNYVLYKNDIDNIIKRYWDYKLIWNSVRWWMHIASVPWLSNEFFVRWYADTIANMSFIGQNYTKDQQDKYYWLIKDWLREMFLDKYINDKVNNEMIEAYYKDIYINNLSPEKVYTSFLEWKEQFKNTITSNRNLYYWYIKEWLYYLLNNKYISENDLKFELDRALKNIFTDWIDPDKVYADYFQWQNQITNNNLYDLQVKDFNITYDDDKISKIDFQVCNIWKKVFDWQLNLFFTLKKNLNEWGYGFEHIVSNTIWINECKSYNLNETQINNYINNLFWSNNSPDYKKIIKWFFYGILTVQNPNINELNYENNKVDAIRVYVPNIENNNNNNNNTNIKPTNTYWLPSSLINTIDNRILSMSNNEREIFLFKIIDKIDTLLQEKSLPKKTRLTFISFKSYLIDYLNNITDSYNSDDEINLDDLFGPLK